MLLQGFFGFCFSPSGKYLWVYLLFVCLFLFFPFLSVSVQMITLKLCGTAVGGQERSGSVKYQFQLLYNDDIAIFSVVSWHLWFAVDPDVPGPPPPFSSYVIFYNLKNFVKMTVFLVEMRSCFFMVLFNIWTIHLLALQKTLLNIMFYLISTNVQYLFFLSLNVNFFSRSGKKTFMFPQCFLFVCLLSPENLKLLACYCVIFHVFVLLHLFLMASETSSYLIPLLPSLSVYSWWKSELRVFFLCTCDSKPPHFQVWDLFWIFFPHLLLFIIFCACCISVPGPVVFIPALKMWWSVPAYTENEKGLSKMRW